jgi:phosphatidylglycerol:prolipoprotein diacylglycerol transferase
VTLYPLVFHVGPLMVTGYGIMLMVAFLMAGWVMQLELNRRGLREDYATDVVVGAVIGGIIGAKVWYAMLYHDWSSLIARGGLVWYGGFLGGCIAVMLTGWWRRVPIRFTMELVAPALAVGYALGRVGCFLVEDDYGIPTSLPWGFKFPQGTPPTTAQSLARDFGVSVPPGTSPTDVLAVHPTELYEVALMLLAFFLIWRLRRHERAVGWLFGVYLVLGGIERFVIEFLRAKDDRLLGPFTLAQAASALVVLLGVYLLTRWARRDDFTLPQVGVLQRKPAT